MLANMLSRSQRDKGERTGGGCASIFFFFFFGGGDGVDSPEEEPEDVLASLRA